MVRIGSGVGESEGVRETQTEKERKMRSWISQTRRSLGCEHPAVKLFDAKCGGEADRFPDHFRILLKAWLDSGSKMAGLPS